MNNTVVTNILSSKIHTYFKVGEFHLYLVLIQTQESAEGLLSECIDYSVLSNKNEDIFFVSPILLRYISDTHKHSKNVFNYTSIKGFTNKGAKPFNTFVIDNFAKINTKDIKHLYSVSPPGAIFIGFIYNDDLYKEGDIRKMLLKTNKEWFI